MRSDAYSFQEWREAGVPIFSNATPLWTVQNIGTNAVTWVAWNTDITSSSTATCSNIVTWQIWNNNYGGTSSLNTYVNAYGGQRGICHTSVESAAREEREAKQRAEFLRAEEERAKARERAEKLLRENLDDQQIEELDTKGHFHLESIQANGERRKYRINRGRARNVQLISPEGAVLRTYCAHPVEDVPDADTMLAQKLYLEGAEEEFLRIANVS